MILEGDNPEVAMVNVCQAMRVGQLRWRFNHRRALAAAHLLRKEKRHCDGRFVSRDHFFRHSRGFLWFVICNLLVSGSTGGAEAQLLINVQNQVRAGESSENENVEEDEEEQEEVLPMEGAQDDEEYQGVDFEELIMQSAENAERLDAGDQPQHQ